MMKKDNKVDVLTSFFTHHKRLKKSGENKKHIMHMLASTTLHIAPVSLQGRGAQSQQSFWTNFFL